MLMLEYENVYYFEAGTNLALSTPRPSAGNSCLKEKNTPMYMSPVQPDQLLQLINPTAMPPAQAPNPLLEVADVSESPLPAVVQNSSTTIPAETPKGSGNGVPQISVSGLLSFSAMIVAVALLL